MSLWVKVCGLRSAAEVAMAVAAGVDAIGFVFASSVRRITPAAAAAAAAAAPAGIARVAVFLHPTQAEVDAVLAEFTPDLVQLDLADFAALRLPPTLGQLPVVRVHQRDGQTALRHEAWPPELTALPARCLVESPRSGRGEVADWPAAAALAARTQVVLAGGLNPQNIAAAVAAVRPWGVDVSSGVECAPGVKDAARMQAFVTGARSVVLTALPVNGLG